jgi:glycosyltransferase involved in cell wall biosynthesis
VNVLLMYAEDYPWDVRVEKIARGLVGDGHEVSLLVRNLKRRPRHERLGDLNCWRVTAPRWPAAVNTAISLPAFFNPVWRYELRRVLRSCAADLLIVRDLPLSPVGIVEGRRRGIPVLIDMAENHPAMWKDVADDSRFRPLSLLLKNPTLADWMERWVVTRADALFVVVEEMRDRLLALGADPERISIVSNTPMLEQFDGQDDDGATEELPPDEMLDIIYVGYINEFRGLQHVIRAMGLLDDMQPRPRLIVAGDGDNLGELEALAREMGVADRVVFAGWVPYASVPSLIRRADIGVIPHRRTGHTDSTVPNKIFDYMACRKPVLVTDARPLARIVRELDCGLAFSSENPLDLADKLRLLADPALRERMGTNGRAAVERRYNWLNDLSMVRKVVARLA